MMKLSNLILTASLGLAAMPGAWAAIILADNTSEHFDSDDRRSFSDEQRWAAAFETDGQSYSLTSVTLWKARNGLPTISPPLMDIYTSTGSGVGEPGTLVGAMTSPASLENDYAEAVFTSPGLTLAAGSRYWLVCRASGDDNYDWGFTTSTTGIGVGFVVAQSESFDFGVTWSSADVDPFLIKVEADVIAVPEPSQWGLLGATLAGAAGVLIRQRRTGAAGR